METKKVTILKSSDYSLLKLIDYNRKINENHVQKLIASIGRKDLTEDFPIIVDKNYNILDGQHRYEACRRMGKPIWYKISEIMAFEDVPLINSLGKSWTPEDYLREYVKRGHPEYIKLANFIHKAGISLAIALHLISNDGGGGYAAFREGKFVYPKDDTKTWDIVNHAQEMAIEAGISFGNSRSWYIAVYNIYQTDGYSKDKMIQKICDNSAKIVKSSNAYDYIQRLEEVYNYRAGEKAWLRMKRPSYSKVA